MNTFDTLCASIPPHDDRSMHNHRRSTLLTAQYAAARFFGKTHEEAVDYLMHKEGWSLAEADGCYGLWIEKRPKVLAEQADRLVASLSIECKAG